MDGATAKPSHPRPEATQLLRLQNSEGANPPGTMGHGSILIDCHAITMMEVDMSLPLADLSVRSRY